MGKLKDKIKKELDRDVRRVKVEVYQDVKYVKTHMPKVISAFIIVIFFIILFVIFKTKQGDKFNQTTEKMLAKANTKDYVIKPSKLKKVVSTNLENYQVIDIRSSKERKIFQIENTIHIPFERILENEYKQVWNSKDNKILVCQNEIESTQAWLILSELGYTNIFVLEGGTAFFKEYMKSEFGFKTDKTSDDEKPKYNYKKIMDDFKKPKAKKNEVGDCKLNSV
jgi:rhodanese-related sulfurtransferase